MNFVLQVYQYGGYPPTYPPPMTNPAFQPTPGGGQPYPPAQQIPPTGQTGPTAQVVISDEDIKVIERKVILLITVSAIIIMVC